MVSGSMNFYQRANLSMSIAVLFGFQLAVSDWVRVGPPAYSLETAYLIGWIAFQFLFRIKVTIDDHYHFKSPSDGKVGPADHVLLIDFVLFSISSLLFMMAAVFSLTFTLSASFFMSGLFVATIWAAVHSLNIKSIFQKAWIALNLAYGALILMIIFGPGDIVQGFWFALLLALLILDYTISETVKHMPTP